MNKKIDKILLRQLGILNAENAGFENLNSGILGAENLNYENANVLCTENCEALSEENLKNCGRKLSDIKGGENKIWCFVFGKNFSKAKAELLRRKIHIESEYPFINSFLCRASRKEIVLLCGAQSVAYISSVSTASTMMFVSKKILQVQKFGCFGQGVGVAFIDTGLFPHADFFVGRPRVAQFLDFVSGKKNMYDDNGHGTFVCGVCSGNGAFSGRRFSGVAPQSQIFALKALNAQGEASASKILDAMEWIFSNHKRCGIAVVCMSFGSEPLGHNDPIMLGAEALWREGVVVVAAAGNSGPEYQTIKSPGISSQIITVGGIDDNRYDNFSFNRKFFEVADFSSRGPAFRNVKPDVVAPSVDIVSCGRVFEVEKNRQNVKANWQQSGKGNQQNGKEKWKQKVQQSAKQAQRKIGEEKANLAEFEGDFYVQLSGTSVATPMVAGLCCLLKEKYPNASPNEIKRMLLAACRPLGFERNFEGYGVPSGWERF